LKCFLVEGERKKGKRGGGKGASVRSFLPSLDDHFNHGGREGGKKGREERVSAVERTGIFVPSSPPHETRKKEGREGREGRKSTTSRGRTRFTLKERGGEDGFEEPPLPLHRTIQWTGGRGEGEGEERRRGREIVGVSFFFLARREREKRGGRKRRIAGKRFA